MEYTPEEYKVETMKQNMARRFADYEDAIATLQTQVAMLQSEQAAKEPESAPEKEDASSNALVSPE